jgi:hypothetical protein
MEWYVIQQRVDGRWYTVQTFTMRREAESFLAFLGKHGRLIVRH